MMTTSTTKFVYIHFTLTTNFEFIMQLVNLFIYLQLFRPKFICLLKCNRFKCATTTTTTKILPSSSFDALLPNSSPSIFPVLFKNLLKLLFIVFKFKYQHEINAGKINLLNGNQCLLDLG